MTARRTRWQADLETVRQMHARVLEAERLLSGAALWADNLPLTNASVAQQFDDFCAVLHEQVIDGGLSPSERRCLEHFLHVTTNMRRRLIQCYDLRALPRTNNDMEGFIRSIKTRYRRLSGRKNWNRYLLRYGRRVAYYEAGVRMTNGASEIEASVRQVPHSLWRRVRAEQRWCQEEQLKQYRVRHRRQQFLVRLEARWAETTQGTGLLP